MEDAINRWPIPTLPVRLLRIGTVVGFFLGIGEGLLLYFNQRPELFAEHPLGPAVLIIAPAIEAIAFGILGGVIGLLVKLTYRAHPRISSGLVHIGLFITGAYMTFLPAHLWVVDGEHRVLFIEGWTLLGGVLVTGVAHLAWRALELRPMARADQVWTNGKRLLRAGALIWAAGIILGAALRMLSPGPSVPPGRSLKSGGERQPNIVMIAVDTARADHFSSYGYAKPTTPNFDNLAKEGVLFETAVAPTSWTLPSFATVFTGLLPHQHGANADTRLSDGSATLASILRAHGYQTAGFNANFTYGTKRTGLAQGFDTYFDDDGSLSETLASISSVKIFWWLVYYPFIQPDTFTRSDARELNQPALHWLKHRSNQPFFLFLNYFDAHEPYHELPALGNLFGDADKTLAQRLRAERNGVQMGIETPRSASERSALIAGYDSGIAWADRQAGDLIRLLQSSPDWSNTYVIVFSDHGESFGEHGHYGHGWGLNWELLHVPFIIAGPGIPHGQRVADLVALQNVFSTVLDLKDGGDVPPPTCSLRCYWTLPGTTCDPNPKVISEFSGDVDEADEGASVSLITPGTQFIHHAAGGQEFYHFDSDPGEELNLYTSPERQNEVQQLQKTLSAGVRLSSRPWLGEDYLWGLGRVDYAQATNQVLGRPGWWPEDPAQRRADEENQLLHSLPYH